MNYTSVPEDLIETQIRDLYTLLSLRLRAPIRGVREKSRFAEIEKSLRETKNGPTEDQCHEWDKYLEGYVKKRLATYQNSLQAWQRSQQAREDLAGLLKLIDESLIKRNNQIDEEYQALSNLLRVCSKFRSETSTK